MSQLTAGAHEEVPYNPVPGRTFPEFRADNINLPVAAGGGLANVLLGLGVIGLGLGIGGGFATGKVLHAIAAYHIGAFAALTMSLGCLFLVMVFHLTNAGWTGTIRRQIENVMTLVPVCAVLVLLGIVADVLLGRSRDSQLFMWLHHSVADNYLLEKKSSFLNPAFFTIRAAIYVSLWTFLTRRLWYFSTLQDRTGDRSITARARFMSAWGMLCFALSVAFAGFDWMMSIDFTFFSTMWGVYIFAGSVYSAVALMAIIFATLRRRGVLEGIVTAEHFHDLGKLLFTFTVFWAYIGFSQYFLIWYGNIPEETAFFNARSTPGWMGVGAFLCIGHFLAPFLVLLFRRIKRTPVLLATLAGWSILAHIVDLFWIVRPVVYAGAPGDDKVGVGGLWIDAACIIGVLAIFGSLIVRKIRSGILVAVNDPRMEEAMTHKNYV